MTEVEIFLTRPIRWATGNPYSPHALAGANWVHLVPEPVATAAVAAGCGVRTDTPEGREAFEAMKRYREKAIPVVPPPLRPEDCEDLGDPLGLLQPEATA